MGRFTVGVRHGVRDASRLANCFVNAPSGTFDVYRTMARRKCRNPSLEDRRKVLKRMTESLKHSTTRAGALVQTNFLYVDEVDSVGAMFPADMMSSIGYFSHPG